MKGQTVTDNAINAIKRSISHTEIVTLDYDSLTLQALKLASDDWTAANGVVELWGNDNGDQWRVHVKRET